MPVDSGERTRPALVALATDVVCVLVFCTIGRRSHAEGLTLTGIAETAWPFLAGTAVGWLLSRGWRRPAALVPTGRGGLGVHGRGRNAVAQSHISGCRCRVSLSWRR